MHETAADLSELQAVLDRSYGRAGEHLLAIHQQENRMDARQVCELLRGVCVLDLATVSRSGAPIVAPVDGLFLKGRFWFGSAPSSVRFRHIRANPQVSAAYTLGEQISVLVHGVAHEIDTGRGEHEALHEYCLEVYGDQFDSWGFWGRNPYAFIEAKRFYAAKMPG